MYTVLELGAYDLAITTTKRGSLIRPIHWTGFSLQAAWTPVPLEAIEQRLHRLAMART